MARKVTDFGGLNHGTKKGRLVSTANSRGSHCNSCGKLQYTPNAAFQRAARPRCYHCGGTLIESEASYKRRNDQTKKEAAQALQDGIGYKPLTCKHCGKHFRSKIGLKLHIEDNHAA